MRRHEDQELISSEASHQVRAPGGLAQPVGNLYQQLVSSGMAKGIVHVLEVIQVDKDQSGLTPDPPDFFHCARETLNHVGAVGQACQPVVQGQKVRLGLRAFQRTDVSFADKNGVFTGYGIATPACRQLVPLFPVSGPHRQRECGELPGLQCLHQPCVGLGLHDAIRECLAQDTCRCPCGGVAIQRSAAPVVQRDHDRGMQQSLYRAQRFRRLGQRGPGMAQHRHATVFQPMTTKPDMQRYGHATGIQRPLFIEHGAIGREIALILRQAFCYRL